MISLEHFKISKTLIFIINFNNLVRSVIIGRISMILVCDMFLFLCSVFAGAITKITRLLVIMYFTLNK